jgi:hypothetical protein
MMVDTDDVLEMSNFEKPFRSLPNTPTGFNLSKMLQIDSSSLTAFREKLAPSGRSARLEPPMIVGDARTSRAA